VTTLTLSLAADFADVFEVREASPRRSRRGHALAARRLDRGLVLAYVGEDDVFRETIVEFAPQPVHVELNAERALATWDVALDPREDMDVLITVEPSIGGQRRPRRRLRTAAQGRGEAYAAWRTECTRVESDNELFNRVVEASTRDLRMLLTPAPGGDLPAAGIPWYVAPFGRDSLLASGEALALNPDLARRTLRVLAGLRARTDDAWRDAEPGKILHELRDGELARAGIVPHTPYYGTVDATPLFLYLAAEYHRWTDDVETLTELRPALDAALQWMDEHGDRDGDGFLEYERRSPAGLRNQGWKDSDDCIVHADGSLAEGPIALVEVQGYAYQAKLGAADVYEALGEGDRAWELRRQAQTLREAFNYAFWDPDEGSFALALDGAKRQVRSVTSNPAHCLACGIVDADKAGPLVERLMAPDMFTGWGIRTLSGDSPAFNPMSYHNGSIWPHDNAIAAAGLKRYGFHDATLRIATALFDVAAGARDYRLPELYCGFDRGMATSAVAYPVACIPQAWAAAAPFMLLQTLLGISPRAPGRALTVNSPVLPEWLGKVELRGLRVGDATVGLVFEREGATTRFSLLERSGAVEVKLSQ